MDESAISRVVKAAAGPFAPGHLGELTQQVPFEMIDAVLSETGAAQRRVRTPPARVVVYLLLAGCLFAELGYRQVWHRLIAGFDGLDLPVVSSAALSHARRRLGVAPMRALFDLLRGPAATTAGQVRWRGLLVCAIDGTLISVADSPANLTTFVKQAGGSHCGGGSYPTLRLLSVLACGTRTVIDAVFGPASNGETHYASTLFGRMDAGLLVLADRNFAAGYLLAAIADRGAHLLVRVRTGATAPRLPVLRRHQDGSYQSVFGGRPVRVIEAEIAINTTAATTTGVYRLITTLLDPQRHPAADLIQLYHERWEIETAYLELKSSILGGKVLRARTPNGINQEIYALLITYQILRTAMTDATNSIPGLDPDRASFSTALHAARDQLIQAAGIIASTTIDLVGAIGRVLLGNLLPARRLRTNARTVKRAISKYNARGPNINRHTYQAAIAITILAGPA